MKHLSTGYLSKSPEKSLGGAYHVGKGSMTLMSFTTVY